MCSVPIGDVLLPGVVLFRQRRPVTDRVAQFIEWEHDEHALRQLIGPDMCSDDDDCERDEREDLPDALDQLDNEHQQDHAAEDQQARPPELLRD